MYAHLVLFTLGPGNRRIAEEMADKFATIYADCPNCRQVTFLGDDVPGEYGSISLWDSKEALAEYRRQAGPQLAAALQGLAKGAPIIRNFEVYEPRSF